jgi:cytochrome c oxidase subunit 2
MGIRVVAENEEEFQSWVEDWRTPAPTANAPEDAVAEGGEATQAQGSADEAGGTQAADGEASAPQAAAAQTPAEDPLVARGRQVFFRETTCVLCHAIQGTPAPGVIGPNLTRLGSRTTIAAGMLENTPENLELWIRDPLSVKPGAQMPGAEYGATIAGIPYPATGLNDEQIQALAAYLSSMR